MNLLITNDDGINAQGIAVLARAAAAFGKVTVVAPARQCSAMSHRITLGHPLRLEAVDFPVENVTAYSLDGTPADCVKAALDAILPEKPDVVLSGINHGYNVGYDVVYSGTVGAAMEALMNGIPAIAFSNGLPEDYSLAERHLADIARKLMRSAPGSGRIWNVNFPGVSPEELRGIAWDATLANSQMYKESYDVTPQEDGSLLLRGHGTPLSPDAPVPENSDIACLRRGCISVGTIKSPVVE